MWRKTFILIALPQWEWMSSSTSVFKMSENGPKMIGKGCGEFLWPQDVSIDNFSLHVNFWNRADALVPQRQVFKTTQGNSDEFLWPQDGLKVKSEFPWVVLNTCRWGTRASALFKTDVEEDIHSHCSPTTYVTNRQRYRALSKEETNCLFLLSRAPDTAVY
jgi:hypothetical protein